MGQSRILISVPNMNTAFIIMIKQAWVYVIYPLAIQMRA